MIKYKCVKNLKTENLKKLFSYLHLIISREFYYWKVLIGPRSSFLPEELFLDLFPMSHDQISRYNSDDRHFEYDVSHAKDLKSGVAELDLVLLRAFWWLS